MIDYRGFIEKYYTITDIHGRVKPMEFNDIQNYYYDLLLEEYSEELQGVRENILKSRRFGFSSLIDAIFCVDFIVGEAGLVDNLSTSAVYSHKAGETQTLFRRVNQFIDSWALAVNPRPGTSQPMNYANPVDRTYIDVLRKALLKKDVEGTQIEGNNGSVYDCLTAGAKVSGRGGTYQNIHWSEVAFYNDTKILDAGKLVVGAEEQVSSGVGKVFRETTGNISDNFFAKEYADGKEGKTQFKSRFLPWYMFKAYQEPAPADWTAPEYYKQIENITKDQAYWHYKKTNGLSDKLRIREYPTTDTEAFLMGGDPYFDADALVWYHANTQKPIRECNFVGGLK